ncbi:MAG: ATP-binding protein [Victivallales bacterium]|nr:ATP-binding protein [Victivallales bacterium]
MQITVCRGVLILPYKNGYLSTVCCDIANRKYRDPLVLYEYLKSHIADEAMYYIFLDEIQFVANWPEIVNSLKAKYRNVSIFVTGSNSDLLADDKERILGGRTLNFRIMPFSFSEYYNYRTELNGHIPRDVEVEFSNYMRWGGFPLIFAETDDDRRQVMLESIFDSIVLRDIVTKLKLKNSYQLERVLDYVIASTGNYISGRSITERFASEQPDSASLPKVLEYLHGIEQSCIVNIVPRFDVIGLKVLEFNNKSYTCDPSFVNLKKSLVSDLYGAIYETIVYNELIFRGYTVRTGSVYGKEIDFVATRRQDEKLYIQVAYEITDGNREREFGNFAAIRDNYPKMVISRDRIPLSDNGIIHRNIIDFLLEAE